MLVHRWQWIVEVPHCLPVGDEVLVDGLHSFFQEAPLGLCEKVGRRLPAVHFVTVVLLQDVVVCMVGQRQIKLWTVSWVVVVVMVVMMVMVMEILLSW